MSDYESLEEAQLWSPEHELDGHSRDSSRTWLQQTQEEGWKLDPLEIPDREAQRWERTHPLEQIRWTHEKNRLTNGHFTRVVRAIKEWKRGNTCCLNTPRGTRWSMCSVCAALTASHPPLKESLAHWKRWNWSSPPRPRQGTCPNFQTMAFRNTTSCTDLPVRTSRHSTPRSATRLKLHGTRSTPIRLRRARRCG